MGTSTPGFGCNQSKFDHCTILLAYEKDDLHNVLDPADVRAMRNVNVLSGYLPQYITKNADRFSRAVWHCNRSMSALVTSTLTHQKNFAETGTRVDNFIPLFSFETGSPTVLSLLY